ncbi:MAG: FMN-binding protein [Dermatophilaceae bacterium]|nr:FMN-binding protein [Dermatophilaceae bacterium]
MRRIVLWAMSTVTVLVLLFSYSTSRSSTAVVAAESRQVTTTSKTAESSGSSSGSSSASSGDSSGQEPAAAADGTATGSSDASSGTSGSSGSAAKAPGSTTVEGDAVTTRFGNVQVKITVTDGKITASEVLQVPWEDRHDQMINSRAVPVYNDEAVQAQSADIDVVSGATVTWEGYTQSLQSAIDRANI